MEMYKEIGAFTPDSLIVSPDFPILKAGIGLRAGQGVLKRGSLIMKCAADKAGYIAGTVVKVKKGEGEDAETINAEMTIFGILTDDCYTGTDASANNIPAVCYQTGEFNRGAVIVSGENATIDTYEDDLKGIGIYLRAVQNYE